MALSVCMSSTVTVTARSTFSLLNRNELSSSRVPLLSLSRSSLSFSDSFNPLGFSIVKSKNSNRRNAGFSAFCYAPPLTPHNLQWISAVSSLYGYFFNSFNITTKIHVLAGSNFLFWVLILAKGTAVPKAFIVPLFALQAPASVVAWIKGRYGLWSAFLALLVRLFFYIPGELELPFLALLLVIVAPYEAMRLRDTKEGAFISLLIAVYLAFQHFSRTSLQKSFDQGSIVATLAVVCITVASLLLLI